MDVSQYTKHIAKITSTMLGFEDHGILTGFLTVDYGGASQSIGGYDLRAVSTCVYLQRTLQACGVDSWERLKGRTIYVLTEDNDHRVLGIAPLPTEPGTAFLFSDLEGNLP
jgi:hypothetical protein